MIQNGAGPIYRQRYWERGKLSLTLMNYRALAICPHQLSSVIPDLIKLPDPS
jgi:hypothetical protein